MARRIALLALCALACLTAQASAAGLPSGRGDYRSADDYVRDVDTLAAAHPGLVRKIVVGRTVQGRELLGLEIARDVDGDDGRPVALVVGLTHAREWPSGEVAMEYALDLVARAAQPRVSALLSAVRTIVIPVANPDGLVATMTGRPEQRVNADGVDLNRNYGAYWGGPGASTQTGTDTYRGPGPWSEPETQAIHALSQTRPIATVVSLHNIAGLVLRPPGFAALGAAPDETRLRALGDAMAAAIGYRSATDDTLGDITGALEDWNYAAQGALGYTIELGPAGSNVFHGPFAQWVTEQYPGVRDALLLAGEAAADRSAHLLVAGRAPAGRTLTLRKSFTTETSPVCGDDSCSTTTPPLALPDGLDMTMTVPASGRFTWDVGPSTRPWVLKAGGRESWTLECSDAAGVVATHTLTAGRGRTALVDPCTAGSPVRVGAASSFSLAVSEVRRSTLLSRGVPVRARCGRACTVTVTVSLGGRSVATRRVAVVASRRQLVRVRLSQAGTATLRAAAGRQVSVRVRASDDTASVDTVTRAWRP